MSVQIDIATMDGVSERIDALTNARSRGRLAASVAKAMKAASLEVIGHAQKERFKGKGPFPVSQNRLGVRSGLLRRSLRATDPQVGSDGSVSITMGSNVKYFARHEFGFEGKEQVRGHTRRNIARGKIVRGKLSKASISKIKTARKAGVKPTSQVRPHSRKLSVPARAPLGTAIREKGPEAFRGRILRAVNQYFQEL